MILSFRRLAISATILLVASIPLAARAEVDSSSPPPPTTVEIVKETSPKPTSFRLSSDRWSIEITDSNQPSAAVLTTVRLYQPAQDLQRMGPFVFVLNEGVGVTVLDLRNLMQPARQLLLAGRRVSRMELQGASRLILTVPGAEAISFDVSNPSQPKRVELPRAPRLGPLDPRSSARAANGAVGFRFSDDRLEVYDVSTGRVVSTLELSQDIRSLTSHAHVLYAALEPDGVGIIDTNDPSAPRYVDIIATNQPVQDLATRNGELSLKFADGSFSIYRLEDPLNPTPVSFAPRPQVSMSPERLTSARVVLVGKDQVVIEAETPVAVGDRFYIVSPDHSLKDRRSGMLRIECVFGLQAAGPRMRNAYAKPGDRAEQTRMPFKESLMYGDRIPNRFRALTDLWAGPLFGNAPQGTAGGGLLWLFALEYRFGIPLKLAVELGPVTLANGLAGVVPNGYYATPGTAFSGSLRAVVGLALSGFELSVGLGGSVNVKEVTPGALDMGLSARFGSLDGINVTLASNFFLLQGSRNGAFENFHGAFNIPVHRLVTMAFVAGGGLPEWGMGAIDFYGYVVGTGGPGTWIIRTGLGGFGMAQITDCRRDIAALPFATSCSRERLRGGGPVFHLGFDTRF